MCTCASCEFTTNAVQGAGRGFASWPRGNVAGPRRSAADYRGHVAFGERGVSGRLTFGPEPVFPPWMHSHGTMPAQDMAAIRWNLAQSPIAPAAQKSATVYVMADEKAKRPVGRPPLDGVKRVLVSLDRASLERARALGGGKNVSAGIRAALSAAEPKAASGAGS